MKFALDIASYGFGIAGGIFLGLAPFGSKGRSAPHWMRVALWIAGPASLLWGALGLTLILGAETLSAHALYLAAHYKASMAGSGVALLILLFLSGEFFSAFSSRKKPKPQSTIQ